jgi:hypothetical protein
MTDTATQKARDIHRAMQGISLEDWLASADCSSDHPRDMQELFHRVGNESSEDDFVNFITTGELGSVELSEGELDMVAGGRQTSRSASGAAGGTTEHNFACLVL